MNGCPLYSSTRRNDEQGGSGSGFPVTQSSRITSGSRDENGAVGQNCEVALQFMVAGPELPPEREFLRWAGAALHGTGGNVTIRITCEAEMRALNHRWRQRDRSTNVLAFPLHDAGCPLLGDVVICAPVIKREAAAQAKSPDAHWAHITIHGILHLMGYDHTDEKGAAIMETKETAILRGLGFPNPY